MYPKHPIPPTPLYKKTEIAIAWNGDCDWPGIMGISIPLAGNHTNPFLMIPPEGRGGGGNKRGAIRYGGGGGRFILKRCVK